MSDLTPPALDPGQGERLQHDAYQRDFAEREAQIQGRDSWKLERLQHFEEDDPSRDALRRGEWKEALRLLDEERPAAVAAGEEDARRDTAFHRLRIVEEPLTPYMQWELHSLRLWDECGTPTRVLTTDKLNQAEVGGMLPELVVLGGRTLYQVCYTGAGALDGAVRYTEAALVESWESYIKRLYAAAEGTQSYFARRVAHLPPPVSG